MIRSSEVTRNKSPKAVPAKVMAHMELHPQMGGGVRVEHHFTEPSAHPMEVHQFAAKEGEKFADHIMQHSGMSWDPTEGEHQANAGAENEVQRGDNVRA